jgi:hypothetical protein
MGGPRLDPVELSAVPGSMHSRPVRFGNRAAKQRQLGSLAFFATVLVFTSRVVDRCATNTGSCCDARLALEPGPAVSLLRTSRRRSLPWISLSPYWRMLPEAVSS